MDILLYHKTQSIMLIIELKNNIIDLLKQKEESFHNSKGNIGN
jgi:hypothetical protein